MAVTSPFISSTNHYLSLIQTYASHLKVHYKEWLTLTYSQGFIKLKNCIKEQLRCSLTKINPETKKCSNPCLTCSHLKLNSFVPEDWDERSWWFDLVVLDPPPCNDLIKHPLCSWAHKHHNKSDFLPLHFSSSDSSDRSSPSLWSGCPRLHGEIKEGKNIYIKDYVWVVISACLSSDNRKICGFDWKMKWRWGEVYNNQVWALVSQF